MVKVSVIFTSYNHGKFLRESLQSVLSQTYKDFEVVVVDDYSTDSTYKVLLEYAKRDVRFKILKNERKKGACGARNTGLYHATSDLIQFFDSDDEMKPELLSELYNNLSIDVDVITCWTNVVDFDTGKVIKKFENITEGNIHSDLMSEKTYVDTNCALIRKKVVENVGGWSEDCPSYQEWDFHLKLSAIAKYKTHRKHLINYNVGGADTISKSLPRYVAGRLYILNKYKSEFVCKHIISYLKKMLTIYYMILNSNENNEKRNMMNMFVDNTDLLTRILVKCLYIPYCFLKYERK